MRASVSSRGVNAHVLACDGFLVEDRNEAPWKWNENFRDRSVGRAGKSLQQIKARLDAESRRPYPPGDICFPMTTSLSSDA